MVERPKERGGGVVQPLDDDGVVATVVIPAKNEADAIAACVESVLAQDEPRLQVIVVDGASTDRTADIVREIAARDGRVELLTNDQGIIPRSLNLALAAARAPWFVRVDAHAMVGPDYVSTAVAHLRTGQWGGVGGRKDGVGRTAQGRAVAAAMGSRFGVGNSVYHFGESVRTVEHVPFGAYPTALARDIGGWDERLRVNQDFEFDHRVRAAGYELLFDPSLKIDWASRQTVRDLFRQYRRYGRGKSVVAALHPSSIRPRHLAAPALVASWALASGLLLTGRRRSAAALVLPYGVALAAASAATARKVDDAPARRWLPAAFAAMHVGWGLGMWEGIGRKLLGERLPDATASIGDEAVAP